MALKRSLILYVILGLQDVLYPAVFQVIEHSEPELGGLVRLHNDAQDVLISIRDDTQDNLGGSDQNTAILPNFIMDAVHKDENVDQIKGTELPFFDFRQDTVCNLADHFRRQLNPVQVLQLVMDVLGAQPSGIQGDNFIFNSGNIPLAFGNQLQLEFPILDFYCLC